MSLLLISMKLLSNSFCAVSGRPILRRGYFPTTIRHVSFSSFPSPSPKRQRSRWLRLIVLTAVSVGIGAYVRSRQDNSTSTLNPFSFTKYYLVDKEPVSPACSVFTLVPARLGGNRDVYEEAWRTGVWSVTFKQPQLQIGRDYTPIPALSSPSLQDGYDDDGSLRFLIRRDPSVWGSVAISACPFIFFLSLEVLASLRLQKKRLLNTMWYVLGRWESSKPRSCKIYLRQVPKDSLRSINVVLKCSFRVLRMWFLTGESGIRILQETC